MTVQRTLAPGSVVHLCGVPVALPEGAVVETTDGNWRLIDDATVAATVADEAPRRRRDVLGRPVDGASD